MRKRPGPDQIARILSEVQSDLDAGLNIAQAIARKSEATSNIS